MKTVLICASLVCAYAGMLSLCLGLERHFKQIWNRLPTPLLRRALRLCGWLGLAASFASAISGWGWAMGPVAWYGLIGGTGLGLVLLLPYRPRLAVWLAPSGLLACSLLAVARL